MSLLLRGIGLTAMIKKKAVAFLFGNSPSLSLPVHKLTQQFTANACVAQLFDGVTYPRYDIYASP